MGCDIHWHSEVKIDGVWHHYSANSIPRDYFLFALLADVRNYDRDVTPISSPRGFPDDASVVTKIDRDNWDADGHSHSYILSSEMPSVMAQWKAFRGWEGPDSVGFVFGCRWQDFTNRSRDEYTARKMARIEDVRWVFWFDN